MVYQHGSVIGKVPVPVAVNALVTTVVLLYANIASRTQFTFYVEAEITVTNSTPFASDAYPKFGIQVSCEENTIFFYVDADVSYTQKRVGCAQRKLDNSDWDWTATEKLYDVPNMVYSGGSYVKMAVYRDGDMFYYYINDQLIVAYNKFNVFNDTQEATCGFLSFNTGMKIRNYMATQDAAELEEIRSRLQIA